LLAAATICQCNLDGTCANMEESQPHLLHYSHPSKLDIDFAAFLYLTLLNIHLLERMDVRPTQPKFVAKFLVAVYEQES
jgi:hypothetical protein